MGQKKNCLRRVSGHLAQERKDSSCSQISGKKKKGNIFILRDHTKVGFTKPHQKTNTCKVVGATEV